MKDPIIEEIRELRRQETLELQRDPIASLEKTRARVRELATEVEWLGPGVYRAKYRLPENELAQIPPEERDREPLTLREYLKELARWKRETRAG
jgi:hypothetical protein